MQIIALQRGQNDRATAMMPKVTSGKSGGGTVLRQLDEQEAAVRVKLEAEAPKQLPKAIGALTWVLLLRELCA